MAARPARRTLIGEIDRRLHQAGFQLVAGADEAGRGALAGPLVAAAVVLPPGWLPEGLRDGKLLSPRQRERLYGEIVSHALAISVARFSSTRVDTKGLHHVNLIALRQVVRRLRPRPDFVLVDGFSLDLHPLPFLAVRRGDRVAGAVAAAGIVAKVERDRIMHRYDRDYPGYGFAEHKGYGTRRHQDALRRMGPCPLHRRSFAGVSDE